MLKNFDFEKLPIVEIVNEKVIKEKIITNPRNKIVITKNKK